MSFFGLKTNSKRYGVIIDIGSGSVLTAVVYSDPAKNSPKIIWAHRDHMPLRDIDSLNQSAKSVMTALVNAAMLLDAKGRSVLTEHDSSAQLSEVQCTISAPWAYTVTKTIAYSQENPFLITEELFMELTTTIQKKVEDDVNKNEEILNLGLQTITRRTLDVVSNGYSSKEPIGNKVESLALSRVSVVTQEYFLEEIQEIQEKLFTNLPCKKISFILVLFTVSKEVLHHAYDQCLVDITDEATEIGVVREGVLKYCTHTPFGSFSLAREISKITKVPLAEAMGYLYTEEPFRFVSSLPKSQQTEVEAVLESYIELVAKLFKETGDALSIPKRILLHADFNSESLYRRLIEKAVKRTIKSDPIITVLSQEIVNEYYKNADSDYNLDVHHDFSLLAAAQFFHMQRAQQRFEYL